MRSSLISSYHVLIGHVCIFFGEIFKSFTNFQLGFFVFFIVALCEMILQVGIHFRKTRFYLFFNLEGETTISISCGVLRAGQICWMFSSFLEVSVWLLDKDQGILS